MVQKTGHKINKRLPIQGGYISALNDCLLYYSGVYTVVDTSFHLFFVSTVEGVIHSSVLLPLDSVRWTDTGVTIVSDIEENFTKL